MVAEHNQDARDTSLNAPERDVLSPRSGGSSLDSLFQALETQECRLTCYYLVQQDEAIPVVELAKLIAASTQEKAPAALTTDEIARTRASLATNHLPKLEAAGLVHCDGPLVSLAENSTPVRDWLTSTFDLEIE